MSLGKQPLGNLQSKKLRKIERKMLFKRQLKEGAYGLGFFFLVVLMVTVMVRLPPVVNYAIAALVTLGFILGVGWLARYCYGRFSRSGNPAELAPVFFGVNALAGYLFALGLILTSVTGWMDYEDWINTAQIPLMAVLCLCSAAAIVLSLPMMVVQRHFLNTFLPIPLKSAALVVSDFTDGYSDRPAETGVEIQEFLSETGRKLLRKLMFLGIIQDYHFMEEEGGVRLLFRSGLQSPMILSSYLPGFKKPASFLQVAADGAVSAYLSREDYGLLEDPYSYHQLCQEMATMLERSFMLFAEGDEKEAIDLFRIKRKEAKVML